MIFDLVASRKMHQEQRIRTQMELRNLLKILNEAFKDTILSRFIITLGDEFQGALKNTIKFYDIFSFVENELSVNFRCGIGTGEFWSSRYGNMLNPLRVVELDGPAFHRARNALEHGKKNDLKITINTGNNDFDNNFNTISSLIYVIKNHWTDRQKSWKQGIQNR